MSHNDNQPRWTLNKVHPTYMTVTWFYSGLAPVAPGTFGTIAALPLAYLLLLLNNPYLYLGLTVILTVFGTLTTAHYMNVTQQDDPKEVVIDEVVGLLIAAAPLLYFTEYKIIGLGASFILFRFFDIIKPYPVSLADQRHDCIGVMLDDIVAGLISAIILGGVYVYLF